MPFCTANSRLANVAKEGAQPHPFRPIQHRVAGVCLLLERRGGGRAGPLPATGLRVGRPRGQHATQHPFSLRVARFPGESHAVEVGLGVGDRIRTEAPLTKTLNMLL